MNHAYSAVSCSVASGAGYGLLALAGLVGNAHGKASSPEFAVATVGVALILISVAFLSSSAGFASHESVGRTSWQSRARIATLATCPIALVYAALWSGLFDAPQWIGPVGLLVTLLCAVTVFCAAMIYRSHIAIPAWNNWFTLPTFLAIGLATGSGLLNAISFIFGRFQMDAAKFMVFLTLLLTFLVIVLKWLYWRKQRKNARSPSRHMQQLTIFVLDLAFVSCFFSPKFPWVVFGTAPLLLFAAWLERWLYFTTPKPVPVLPDQHVEPQGWN